MVRAVASFLDIKPEGVSQELLGPANINIHLLRASFPVFTLIDLRFFLHSSPHEMAPLTPRGLRVNTDDNTGAIVGIVALALYVLFVVTVAALIAKNKILRRRRQKHAIQEMGYKSLGSQIELVDREAGPDDNVIPQLPTDGEGGEDLEGKPKLEVEGNPLHHLEGTELRQAPYELSCAAADSEAKSNTDEETRPGTRTTESFPRIPPSALVITRTPSPMFRREENVRPLSRNPSSRNQYRQDMLAGDAPAVTTKDASTS
ncbi:hypothetical protein BCR34DRAFT_250151 [Clohesyomyces aquaticus]|uniref:Uncharacterized protein n=1 Tax=Clohesyomyces aquaticus TaxID=1231657 RepID=A0A1Y1Y436_9PLEO|nr:hypothetical protein BCR34DRAFT_250151 [Clohesyomyces aquaticus]